MNITILTGQVEVSKRQELSKIKNKYPPAAVEVLDFKQASLSEINTAILSVSLFTPQKLMVIENVSDDFNLNELSKSEQLELVLIAQNPSVTKTLIKSAKARSAKVVSFEGEKEISAFPFVDAVMEGKKEAFLEMEKLYPEFGAVYIVSILSYGLRRNFLPLPSYPFAKKKIETQRKNLTKKDFIKLYQLVLDADWALKTSRSEERQVLTTLIQRFIQVVKHT